MNKTLFCSFLFFVTCLGQKAFAQNPVNWTKDDLMEPLELATMLKSGKQLPLIFSVGPGATIPQSKHIGMTNDEANLASLKQELTVLPTASSIVIYCGCCPFEHCPNVRPAIALLKQLQFTNYKLLKIPKNLKADWIDKGYPVVNP